MLERNLGFYKYHGEPNVARRLRASLTQADAQRVCHGRSVIDSLVFGDEHRMSAHVRRNIVEDGIIHGFYLRHGIAFHEFELPHKQVKNHGTIKLHAISIPHANKQHYNL